MTEEKALKIFARCYNACDFEDVVRRLHKKASFEAFNRFYRNVGRDGVERFLAEKAAELRALPKPNRAHYGFMLIQRGFSPMLRPESCAVLTQDDPWKVEGVVRIKCTPLHIKDIRVFDPAKCQYTRGDYAD